MEKKKMDSKTKNLYNSTLKKWNIGKPSFQKIETNNKNENIGEILKQLKSNKLSVPVIIKL